MKVGEVVEGVEIPEDVCCEVCFLHQLFRRLQYFDDYECPRCGGVVYIEKSHFVVVGDTNTIDPEESIRLAELGHCDCGATLALLPVPIIYNGSHDVYYTGGKSYLTEPFSLSTTCLASIEQFKKRIQDGEELPAWALLHWIQNDLEREVKTWLVSKGITRA